MRLVLLPNDDRINPDHVTIVRSTTTNRVAACRFDGPGVAIWLAGDPDPIFHDCWDGLTPDQAAEAIARLLSEEELPSSRGARR